MKENRANSLRAPWIQSLSYRMVVTDPDEDERYHVSNLVFLAQITGASQFIGSKRQMGSCSCLKQCVLDYSLVV